MRKTIVSNWPFRFPVWTAINVVAIVFIIGLQSASAQRPLGVDVSSFQGQPNWTSVRNSGITFAWAKATEGVSITDADFVYNENNGKAAGVDMGAYDFAHPNANTPLAEVNHFWAVAGPYVKSDGRTLMPMLDFEVFSGVTGASSYADWANQWCTDVKSDAAGQGVTVKPIVYVSACSACNFNSSVSAWFAWIANYNGQNAQTGTPWNTCTSCEVWGAGVWNVWQYSSTGAVSGISGNVDLDVFNGTASGLAAALVPGAGALSTVQVQVMGDFDGDGKQDIAWRKTGWTEWVIDYGSGAVNAHALTDGRTDFNPYGGNQVVLVGDFDHDGKSDIAWRKTGWTEWIIEFGNGTVNQHALTDGRTDFNPSGNAQVTVVGDFDGDGKSDIAWRKNLWTEWIIEYGNGVVNGHALTDGRTDFSGDTTTQVTLVGDFDHDGKSDIAYRKTGWGEWIVDYGNGVINQHSFTDGRSDFNPNGAQVTLVGDFDGDGKSDLAWRKTGWGNWIIGFGNGAVNGNAFPDGRTDFDGSTSVQMALAADFDGDGKTDIAWRKTGWVEWIIDYGNGAVNGHSLTDGRTDFNPAGGNQVAFAGDFNNNAGDHKCEIPWRKTGWGNWIVVYSSGTGSALNDSNTTFNPALQ